MKHPEAIRADDLVDPRTPLTIQQRVAGLLLAGAVGDAVDLPAEGFDESNRKIFGDVLVIACLGAE
jgi:hypothetical protein